MCIATTCRDTGCSALALGGSQPSSQANTIGSTQALAESIAREIPAEAETLIGEQALAILDRTTLQPSEIPLETKQHLAAELSRFLAGRPDAERYVLEFRKLGDLPNAFAIPGGPIDETLTGSKLSLRSVRNDPATAKKLGVQDTDPAITLGAGTGSADDPTINGATLRVRGTFDVTYPLPRAAGPTSVTPATTAATNKRISCRRTARSSRTIQNGKRVKASGAGAGLGFTLASDPSPVDVVLTTGNTRYCATFGGTTKFKPENFSAKKAPPPAACP
jgi:hypothetical protein